MYIEFVPNRNSPPAVLLRESYRVDGKVKKRTLSNLSALPDAVIEGLKVLLRGGVAVASADEVLTIERSLPHGHVAAVLGAARGCGAAARWFAQAPDALAPILLGLLVARVLEPSSKLATQRMLNESTACNSLGRILNLNAVKVDELYRALDWLGEHQASIEKGLAKQHLVGCTMVLYDLSSTWMTGHSCPLAVHGYSRDGKRHDPQIVFGLLCAPDGCPVAIEVFSGNTADSTTVAAQVEKVRERFGIAHIAWVGDRGMITQTQIDHVLRPNGMDWISSLRAPQIVKLAQEHGPFQTSLFDERSLLEVKSPDFPQERLVVCRNPLLAEERARKRQSLLAATKAELAKITEATTRARRRLQGKERIMARVLKVINRFKMAKHFELSFTESSFGYQRKVERIAEEAAMDGLYVIRTNLPKQALSAEGAVAA
jgi:transposase